MFAVPASVFSADCFSTSGRCVISRVGERPGRQRHLPAAGDDGPAPVDDVHDLRHVRRAGPDRRCSSVNVFCDRALQPFRRLLADRVHVAAAGGPLSRSSGSGRSARRGRTARTSGRPAQSAAAHPAGGCAAGCAGRISRDTSRDASPRSSSSASVAISALELAARECGSGRGAPSRARSGSRCSSSASLSMSSIFSSVRPRSATSRSSRVRVMVSVLTLPNLRKVMHGMGSAGVALRPRGGGCRPLPAGGPRGTARCAVATREDYHGDG